MTDAFPYQSKTMVAGSATAGTAAIPTAKQPSAAALAWLRSRGLSVKTLAVLPVGFGMDRGRDCVFFGQMIDGVSHGYKARPLSAKEFWQKPGTPQRLWNLDQVEGSDRVWITEGEIDALSLVEAGISPKEVVSVFGGAKGEEEANLKQAHEALEQLRGVKTVTICHDADPPGLALRACLAKVLGPARVRFVEWPDGIKDANEMLVKDGADALRDLVTAGSQPWPIDGLYRLSELPEPPPFDLWDAGFPEWQGGMKMAPGMFSVVTGHGGHGKTVFMAQVWQQIARQHLIRVAVCSMETRAKPHFRRNLRQFFFGRAEKYLEPHELAQADKWIDDHYRFIQHPDERPDLRWLLDVAEGAVLREGCKAIVIDPWNKLERARDPRQSETDYIGQVLDELMLFAKDLRCHVQIVAHPTKNDMTTRGKAPDLENIAGSKAWETKPDQGFVMFRPKMFDGGQRQTDCEFIVRKTRFEELGFPRLFKMKYDLDACRYVSTDAPLRGVV